jgi:hypothetical protein
MPVAERSDRPPSFTVFSPGPSAEIIQLYHRNRLDEHITFATPPLTPAVDLDEKVAGVADTETDSNSQSMSMATEAELTDAKIAASEARGDTKIARMEGKLDLVLEAVRTSREEARDNRRAVIANGWVIFGALVVVLGIMVTVAPVVFDMGFKWRETISREVQERMPAPIPSVRPNTPR